MHYSLAIVTRNRSSELTYSLRSVSQWFPASEEIVVYDDCSSDGTSEIVRDSFRNVVLVSGTTPLGGVGAKRELYKKLRGDIIVGLDDDAHILSPDPLTVIDTVFSSFQRCGIVAFDIMSGKRIDQGIQAGTTACNEEVREFVACGYAMRKECYVAADEYPFWMNNIYGEETYLSLGAYRAGWTIRSTSDVVVHHRVDMDARKKDHRRAMFWMQHQMDNLLGVATTRYPLRAIPPFIASLVMHNFIKYALNTNLMLPFVRGIAAYCLKLPILLKERKSLNTKDFLAWRSLPGPVLR